MNVSVHNIYHLKQFIFLYECKFFFKFWLLMMMITNMTKINYSHTKLLFWEVWNMSSWKNKKSFHAIQKKLMGKLIQKIKNKQQKPKKKLSTTITTTATSLLEFINSSSPPDYSTNTTTWFRGATYQTTTPKKNHPRAIL